MSRVLGREGADPNVSGNFYKAVAQAVLLFGAKTWVLTQRMEKALEIFQSRVARRLTGKHSRQKKYGSWDYPPLAEAMGEAGDRGGTEVNNTKAEHGLTIYCDATDSGPMQAGHSAARSAGAPAVVGAGRNRPGGGEETGGGVNNEIGDRVGGGVGQETERIRGRRGGVSGSERVKWSGLERGG